MADDPPPFDYYAAVLAGEDRERRAKEARFELLLLVMTMDESQLPEVLRVARRKLISSGNE